MFMQSPLQISKTNGCQKQQHEHVEPTMQE